MLGISPNESEKKKRTSLKEKETIKICHVNVKYILFIMMKYVWSFLEIFWIRSCSFQNYVY